MEVLGYSNILHNCIENITLLQEQIEDFNCATEIQLYTSLDTFSKEIGVVSKKLSFECTKLCISFSNSPLPSSVETSALLQGIERTLVTLVSVFSRYNPSFGRTLRQHLTSCVNAAIRATKQLISVIKEHGQSGIREAYLQATGVVWQGCEAFESLPKDNQGAVLLRIREQSSLVTDAFDEITEALEGDGSDLLGMGLDASDSEEDVSWTPEDKETLAPSVNIIKAAKAMFRKIVNLVDKNGQSDSCERVSELDQILEDVTPVPEMVDSLILELYPPLDVASMQLQSHALAASLHTALKTTVRSHVTPESERAAVEFLRTAVEHNLNKMKEVVKGS